MEFIAQEPDVDRKVVINEKSIDADLTIVGLQGKALKRQKTKLFEGFEQIGNVLFVNATKEIEIVAEEPEEQAPPASSGGETADAAARRELAEPKPDAAPAGTSPGKSNSE